MEEKKINERLVMFQGKACIEKDLELGQEVEFNNVKGGVIKIEDVDNDDGTKDKVFKVKLITVGNEGTK